MKGKLSSTLMNEYNPFIEHHIYKAEKGYYDKTRNFFSKGSAFSLLLFNANFWRLAKWMLSLLYHLQHRLTSFRLLTLYVAFSPKYCKRECWFSLISDQHMNKNNHTKYTR